MNQRERTLAIGFGAVVIGWLLWGVVKSRVIEPLQSRDSQIIALETDLQAKQKDLMIAQHAAMELSQWRQAALPAEESVAQTLYLDSLRMMLTSSGIDRPTVRPGRAIRREGVFARIPVNIDARCSLVELTNFLRQFEAAPYMHQIRRLRLQPVLKDDLIIGFDVSLGIEAVSMDDAFVTDKLPGDEHAKIAFSDRVRRADDEFTLFEKKNPFQPTEMVPVAEQKKEEETKADESDERENYYLTATLYSRGAWEGWLTKRGGDDRKVLRAGEKLKVGGMSAEIVRIEPDFVVLKVDDRIGLVRIGNNLASWKGDTAEMQLAAPPSADSTDVKKETGS